MQSKGKGILIALVVGLAISVVGCVPDQNPPKGNSTSSLPPEKSSSIPSHESSTESKTETKPKPEEKASSKSSVKYGDDWFTSESLEDYSYADFPIFNPYDYDNYTPPASEAYDPLSGYEIPQTLN